MFGTNRPTTLQAFLWN